MSYCVYNMNLSYYISIFFLLDGLAEAFFRAPYSVSMSRISRLYTTDLPPENTLNYHWYVVSEKSAIKTNRPYKITIWNKHYVLWRTVDQQYHAIDNECSHRGASLADGVIIKTNIMCPYHGYEFDTAGTLVHVPGLANFTNTPCQNAPSYHVVEQDGWLYMNTIPKTYFPFGDTEVPHESPSFYTLEDFRSCKNVSLLECPTRSSSENNDTREIPCIYREPEASNKNFTRTLIKAHFENYGRIISENSLDVMHIGFVHSFGNRKRPSPFSEVPPHRINDTLMHYRTKYEYESGEKSFAKRAFSVNQLKIENEFVLPHTTVARVLFGPFVSTIITAALPVNDTHTTLFVKTYRNYWNTLDRSFFGQLYNSLGDTITRKLMTDTVNQDKGIVEGILPECKDGRFNMKFDKLQNTYRTFYKKFIDPK